MLAVGRLLVGVVVVSSILSNVFRLPLRLIDDCFLCSVLHVYVFENMYMFKSGIMNGLKYLIVNVHEVLHRGIDEFVAGLVDICTVPYIAPQACMHPTLLAGA